MVTKTIDRVRVERALQAASARSAIEIVVSVAPFFWGDVRANAERVFRQLSANGRTALILVVPRRRRVVVLGDEQLHERFGQRVWNEVASAMAERFSAQDPTDALELGILQLSTHAAMHFPAPSE